MCSGPVGLADTNSTLTRARLVGREPAPRAGRREDPGDGRLERRVRQPQVDEPGPRDLGRGDQRAVGSRADRLGERLGDVQRRAAQRPCELHREVGREVAERRVRRAARRRRPGRSAPSSIAGRAPDRDGGVPRPVHGVADLRPDGGRGGAGRPGLGTDRSPVGSRGKRHRSGRLARRTRGPGHAPIARRRRRPSSRSRSQGVRRCWRSHRFGADPVGWVTIGRLGLVMRGFGKYFRKVGHGTFGNAAHHGAPALTLGPRDPDGTHKPECVPSVVPGSREGIAG